MHRHPSNNRLVRLKINLIRSLTVDDSDCSISFCWPSTIDFRQRCFLRKGIGNFFYKVKKVRKRFRETIEGYNSIYSKCRSLLLSVSALVSLTFSGSFFCELVLPFLFSFGFFRKFNQNFFFEIKNQNCLLLNSLPGGIWISYSHYIIECVLHRHSLGLFSF